MRQVDGSVGGIVGLVLGVMAIVPLAGGAGCGQEPPDSGRATVQALTVPVPPVTQFAVLAGRTASIGDRSQVNGGDVGVAAGATNSLTTGSDSRVGVGEILLAPVMTLRDRTTAGEIGANTISVGANVVTGPRSAYVAPPAAPAIAAFTVGTTAVSVNGGQTRSLAPGKYGAVTVNGTLNLSGGLYEIHSLRIGADARVAAVASSTLRVQTGIQISDRGDLVGPANPGARGLRVTVNGTIDGAVNSLSLGVDVQLTAIVVARNTFRAADRLIARGAIAAQDVFIANVSTLTFGDGFGCSSNASCNDNSPCTTDACADAACTFTSAANGTACNDNNGCTQSSTCQAGTCTGADPVVCTPSDQCHVAGTCNPTSGTCSNPNAPNGTTCNDNDVCTTADACQGGTCTGGPSIVTEYASGLPQPKQITPGPDGNLWFVASEVTPGVGAVARIVPASGTITSFVTNTSPRTRPLVVDDIVTGADGNLWFTGRDASLGDLPALATVTPAGMFIIPDIVGSAGPAIAAGPDGNLWTGGSFLDVIDVVWRQSSLTTFVEVSTTPRALVAGPDTNVWFVASDGNGAAFVGRVVPGELGNEIATEFPVMTSGHLNDIAVGPDGNLWFTDAGQNEIGRITTAGVITKFGVPTPASGVHGIIAGPDGNLWFTENLTNKIGRITPAGAVTELACIPTENSGPTNITLGSDGNLWLTETGSGKIARVQLP
jgi:hypothetical protein